MKTDLKDLNEIQTTFFNLQGYSVHPAALSSLGRRDEVFKVPLRSKRVRAS